MRSLEDQRSLIDQIRNTLDRGAERLVATQPDFIAGSFAVEAVVHHGRKTQILRLRHRDLGTLHALKTVSPALSNDGPAVRRLLREAEVGIALRHPCLVETSAALRLSDGRPGALQTWHECSLHASLDWLSIDNVSIIIERVLEGLSFMHSENYVHCDVSSANILLASGGFETAKLCDFELTLKIGKRHRDFGIEHAGTPEFAPVEQMTGSSAHPSQDIYAVGRLTQRLIDACGPAVSTSLADFAALCTKTDPQERPQSGQAALAVFRGHCTR